MSIIQYITRGFDRLGTVRSAVAKCTLAGAVGLVTLAAPTVAQAGDRDYRRDDDRRGDYRRDDRWRDHDHDRDRGPRIGIDIRIGEPRPAYRPAPVRVWVPAAYRTFCDRRWVEPVYRTAYERVWVPDVVEEREERCYEGGRWCTRVTRVVAAPGHYETRERRECVSEGRYETCGRQELVADGHWEYR
jgi:hypothetical protein